MSTMQVEVYEAFRSLDVPDEKALKAAVVLGRQGDELAALRTDVKAEFATVRAETKAEFAAVRAEMKTEFAAVRAETRAEFGAVRSEMNTGFARVDVALAALRAEQAIVRWMLGFMLATQVAILFKVFSR